MSETITAGVTSSGISIADLIDNPVDNLTVLSGGTASACFIKIDGALNVSSGGVAIDTELPFGLIDGGFMYIWAGGYASGTVNEDGQEQVLGVNAVDTMATINGGFQLVGSGGTAYQATVGGDFYYEGIDEGGGEQEVYSGATAYSTTVVNNGQQVVVGGPNLPGGQAIDTIVYSGGTVREFDGGTITNATVNYGGSAFLGEYTGHSGGILDGGTINNGGIAIIGSLATAAGTIDLSGTLVFDGNATNDAVLSLAVGGDLIFPGITNTSGDQAIYSSLTNNETFDLGGTVIITSVVGDYANASFSIASGLEIYGTEKTSGTAVILESNPENSQCFMSDTSIATVDGEEAVENLRRGDIVMTGDGGRAEVQWIGVRSYDGRFVGENHLVLPVTISANAIADGVPARDLHVSPGHGVFIDGALVPAWRLINGKTITQPEIMQTEISYYHIELASHAVILAENCPVESYLDDGCRNQFQNAFTHNKCGGAAVTPLPRVESGFVLEAIRARLNARAGIETKAENASNAVIGYVDNLGPNAVSGWAQCPEDPETPVRLDVYFWLAGSLMREEVLANVYRADLRKAGMRSGCHGFEVELPVGAKSIHVLRQADRTPLALTEAAMRTVAAA